MSLQAEPKDARFSSVVAFVPSPISSLNIHKMSHRPVQLLCAHDTHKLGSNKLVQAMAILVKRTL